MRSPDLCAMCFSPTTKALSGAELSSAQQQTSKSGSKQATRYVSCCNETSGRTALELGVFNTLSCRPDWSHALQATFTAALEAGATCFLFQPDNEVLASDWQSIGRFQAVFCGKDPSSRRADGVRFIYNLGPCWKGTKYLILATAGILRPVQVVSLVKVQSKADLAMAEAEATSPGVVVMDASDWQIIPAGIRFWILSPETLHNEFFSL